MMDLTGLYPTAAEHPATEAVVSVRFNGLSKVRF